MFDLALPRDVRPLVRYGALGSFASAALLGAVLAQQGLLPAVDFRRGGGRRHPRDRRASPDRARRKRSCRRRRALGHRAREPRRRVGVLVVRTVWWLARDRGRVRRRVLALARTSCVGRSEMAIAAAYRRAGSRGMRGVLRGNPSHSCQTRLWNAGNSARSPSGPEFCGG